MCKYKIFLHPCDKMIFKCSFDYLMKEVRRDGLINICTWKIVLDIVLWSKSGIEYNMLNPIEYVKWTEPHMYPNNRLPDYKLNNSYTHGDITSTSGEAPRQPQVCHLGDSRTSTREWLEVRKLWSSWYNGVGGIIKWTLVKGGWSATATIDTGIPTTNHLTVS